VVLGLLLTASLCAPDVLFISVDTLRADRLGCYGCPYDTSPNVDRLAEKGLLFENCLCEVPLTNPSFGSMLTSRYPRTTGTTRNGLRMPASFPLVAERFLEAGYQTVCVQSNWTLKADISGLDRGFETYEDDFKKKRWGILKSERYANEVTDVALDLLEKRETERPLFAWVHYSDPHAPYRFHDKFNPGGRKLWKLQEHDQTRAKYDSEVAFTDHHIGRLLDAVDLDNTFVLFVADHGESLHEHGYLGHGRRIYQTGLRIPLIIRGPGIEPGVTDLPVRGVDVAPTLLALAGLEPLPGARGKSVTEKGIAEDRVRVIETYGGAVPKLPGARAVMADRPPMRQGVVADSWKLILRGPKTELYNLREDPAEEVNLVSDEEARVRELTVLIEAWDARYSRGGSDEAELDEDDLEALESLGYLE
jgi:arylsulfatase A-like enzyme